MSEMMTDFVAFVAVASVWLLAGGVGVGMMIPRKPEMPSEQLVAGVFSGPIMLGLAIWWRIG